jgi:hypothetical protein
MTAMLAQGLGTHLFIRTSMFLYPEVDDLPWGYLCFKDITLQILVFQVFLMEGNHKPWAERGWDMSISYYEKTSHFKLIEFKPEMGGKPGFGAESD